jgi:hypothetical protein
MPTSLDEHHAATLSDEELAAIRGDGLSDEDQEDLLQLDSGDDADANEDDADEDDDDDAGDSDDEPSKASETDAEPPAAPQAESSSQSDVRYQAATLPADFQEQISATHYAQRDLLHRFQDGELDASEYVAELSKITEQRDALSKERMAAIAARLEPTKQKGE